MYIKSATKKGTPVTFGAEESLEKAVTYGVKSQNTTSNVYWALMGSVKKDSVSSTVVGKDKWGNDRWEASATGTVLVGRTDAKTDAFHEPQQHKFKIKYASGEDDRSLPDIEVVSFSLVPVKNASEIARLAVDNITVSPPKRATVESVQTAKAAPAAMKKEAPPKADAKPDVSA